MSSSEPKDKLAKIVGRNIVALRKRRSLTQVEVASAARAKGHQLTQSTLARMETCKHVSSIENLSAVAGALSVEPWQLLVRGMDPDNLPRLASVSPEERKLLRSVVNAVEKLGVSA